MKSLFLAMGFLAIACATATAGRNADGAMVLHENDSVTFSVDWNYCSDDPPSAPLPPDCYQLNTNIGLDIHDVAIVWMVAAFPANSSPDVDGYTVGIYGDITADHYTSWSPCDAGFHLEIPEDGWPGPGTGTSVVYGGSDFYSRLFKMYWFAVSAPFAGASMSTGPDPRFGYAEWVDQSTPPNEDRCTLFGRVVWGGPGGNDCPSGPTPTQATTWGRIKSSYK